MASSSDDKKDAPKARRVRAVRGNVRASTQAPVERISKVRATKIVAEKKSEVIEESINKEKLVKSAPAERKAPTPISAEGIARKKANRRRVVVAGLVLLGIGSSAAVGFTDSGQIDVLKTIEERNQRIRTNTTDERDAFSSNVEVPVQTTNTSNKPDGGLKGRGTGGTVPEVAPVATSTATSSEDMASSTDSSLATSTDTTVDADAVEEEATETPTPTEESI
jgi:hypothetical protein